MAFIINHIRTKKMLINDDLASICDIIKLLYI